MQAGEGERPHVHRNVVPAGRGPDLQGTLISYRTVEHQAHLPADGLGDDGQHLQAGAVLQQPGQPGPGTAEMAGVYVTRLG